MSGSNGHKKAWVIVAAICCPLFLIGCRSKPASSASIGAPVGGVQQPAYPARPTVPPPLFKVFHHTDDSFTLVTKDDASDEEVESLVWQLRDAAQTHALDNLKIDQKVVDARKPNISFHLYRGSKCASEKYAAGKPPCGASYHAAGEYTFGSFAKPEWDQGSLLHDENHETLLWDPEAAYTTPR